MQDIYEENNEEVKTNINNKTELKKIYFNFLHDFKDYLAEYIKESVVDLTITEIPITTSPLKFFENQIGVKVIIKNQGENPCYLSTVGMGGYRLDPNEQIKFWLNKPTQIVTAEGKTTIGIIKF